MTQPVFSIKYSLSNIHMIDTLHKDKTCTLLMTFSYADVDDA